MDGGPNGPETVTFTDININVNFQYLVAIYHNGWSDSASEEYAHSGSKIEILSDEMTYENYMAGNNATSDRRFYFFGCLDLDYGNII